MKLPEINSFTTTKERLITNYQDTNQSINKNQVLLKDKSKSKYNQTNNQNNFLKSNTDYSTYITDIPRPNGKQIFRFEKYSDRKEMLKDDKTNILSYIEPKKFGEGFKKLNFDFSKCSKRKTKIIETGIPAICYYNPKYTCFEKNNHILSFKTKIDKSNKRYLIKKLWRSYGVDSQYKTLQLEAFINDFKT